MFGKPPFGRSKYGNRKTEVDGIKFASKAEARHYQVLRDRAARGEIQMLRLQVPFAIEVNGLLICRYVADYCYMENGRYIVCDRKGFRTDVYRLKRRLMKAVHGIEILEV